MSLARDIQQTLTEAILADSASAPAHQQRIPTGIDFADPEGLDAYAARIEALRMQALLDSDGGRAPLADEHFLIALDLLSQAMRHVRLASLHQAAGLAAPRLRY